MKPCPLKKTVEYATDLPSSYKNRIASKIMAALLQQQAPKWTEKTLTQFAVKLFESHAKAFFKKI